MSIRHDTPVQFLKGVGPKLGEALKARGIHTIGDLLEWYPRGYEDRRSVRQIASLKENQFVSLNAQIVRVGSIPLGRSQRRIHEVIIADSSGRIALKYFRQPFRGYFDRFEPHQKVRVSGRVVSYRGKLEFHHPDLHAVNPDEEELKDEVVPLYSDTGTLSPTKLAKLIRLSLEAPDAVPERLPKWLEKKYDLQTRHRALAAIHNPQAESADQLIHFKDPAKKRIIFEEFFWMELLIASRRKRVEREVAPSLKAKGELIARLQAGLEFALTKAQLRVTDEIIKDVERPHPMHRMVQGDVGSGKTLVALMASVHAYEAGFQSALMVPTEILAEQHYLQAKRRLEPLGIKVALLTASLKGKDKQKVYDELEQGNVHLAVGTHALIQDDVRFQKLGLVIIDEQHRFGVSQRISLKQKGLSPHFLVMTATPIPRTLAMTVYGDLDVSVIDELPKGRQPIVTKKTFASKRALVIDFLKQQLAKGHQAYVVYPLIEESEKLDLKNATQEFERLKVELPEWRIGLLHGKMKAHEKEEIMQAFRKHELDVLVATTVIEVGVDVPNANTMIIENAERFGLSQLHQLRGRVGRGPHKSYCVLMLSYAVSEEGIKRAEIMESTTDGFKISEADLEMRGPGEFLGTKQSGLMGFKMAHLVRDQQILQAARAAAFELLERDPMLKSPEHQPIADHLSVQRPLATG